MPSANTVEKVMWVCELTKENPIKKWVPTEAMEDDEDDEDFVRHSLQIKTAVLGSAAKDNERNLVALKTKDFEQPLFSLTLGKNDMVSNFDLTFFSTGDNKDCEFKLIDGNGPIFITCMHIFEIPAPDDETIMTKHELETSEEEDEEVDEEDEDEAEEEEEETKAKPKNGTATAAALKKALKNGLSTNGHKEEIAEVSDRPNKRKRN